MNNENHTHFSVELCSIPNYRLYYLIHSENPGGPPGGFIIPIDPGSHIISS